MRLLAIALAVTLCWGCFALDEIDKGVKAMDHQAGRKPGSREAEVEDPPSAHARKGPSSLDRLEKWWTKQREAPPPAPDPDDVIVRCVLGGATRFTRRSHCQSLGGRVGALAGTRSSGS